jgi:hypothetical protein
METDIFAQMRKNVYVATHNALFNQRTNPFVNEGPAYIATDPDTGKPLVNIYDERLPPSPRQLFATDLILPQFELNVRAYLGKFLSLNSPDFWYELIDESGIGIQPLQLLIKNDIVSRYQAATAITIANSGFYESWFLLAASSAVMGNTVDPDLLLPRRLYPGERDFYQVSIELTKPLFQMFEGQATNFMQLRQRLIDIFNPKREGSAYHHERRVMISTRSRANATLKEVCPGSASGLLYTISESVHRCFMNNEYWDLFVDDVACK